MAPRAAAGSMSRSVGPFSDVSISRTTRPVAEQSLEILFRHLLLPDQSQVEQGPRGRISGSQHVRQIRESIHRHLVGREIKCNRRASVSATGLSSLEATRRRFYVLPASASRSVPAKATISAPIEGLRQLPPDSTQSRVNHGSRSDEGLQSHRRPRSATSRFDRIDTNTPPRNSQPNASTGSQSLA